MNQTIFLVVHSPPSESCDWKFDGLPFGVDKRTIHMTKLAKAVKLALRNKVPVVFEVINELQEKRLIEFLEQNNIRKEDVRMVHTQEIHNPVLLERTFDHQVARFIIAGHYKELCCLTSMEHLRKAFPNAEIIVLKGDVTMSERNATFREMWPHAVSHAAFADKRKELNLCVKPVSRRVFG